MKKQIMALALIVVSTTIHAKRFSGELDGYYKPVAGIAETMEVGVHKPEQIGEVIIYLEREGWKKLPRSEKRRIRRFLWLEGRVRGLVDPATFLADHVIVSNDRSGVLYTRGDYIIPSEGDAFCSGGSPLKGVETINLVAGMGEFANFVHGELKLRATINNCWGSERFGQNDFSVMSEGFLLFGDYDSAPVEPPQPDTALTE